LDKALQLEETPITNPIIHSLSSSDISNSLEVFHNNLASVKIVHNFLADAMIDCSHKLLLSSRNLLEKSSGTSCAFALQFAPQEFESSFNLFDFGRVEELSIRSDGKIMYSQVHAQNLLRNRALGRKFLGECEHEETFAFIIDSQKTFTNFPIEIIFETVGNNKRNFNPSFDCGDTQNIIFERETSGGVVSNGTKLDKWFALGFLDKPTRLFNAGNSKLRRQSKSSQILVNEGMEFDIIPNSHFPSPINTQLHSSFVNGNCVGNFLSGFNSYFSCCSVSHGLLKGSGYLNSSEGISPPNPKGLGYPKCTSI